VPQFVYNATTETLYWDADGAGPIKAAIIASFNETFQNILVTAADIVIIA